MGEVNDKFKSNMVKNIYLLQSLFSANKHERIFKNHACISNENEKKKRKIRLLRRMR